MPPSLHDPFSDGPMLTAAEVDILAVLRQLGLRLESARGPVEVLFIDRVERPSAN